MAFAKSHEERASPELVEGRSLSKDAPAILQLDEC